MFWLSKISFVMKSKEKIMWIWWSYSPIPGCASGEKSTCQCRKCKRWDSIPGSETFLGVGNGNPLQYSCLANPMDRGALWATVHGVAKKWTWLSTHREWGTVLLELHKITTECVGICYVLLSVLVLNIDSTEP